MIGKIRNAEPSDVDTVARLWHDGWYEAHEAIVPAALTKLRTLESFQDRTTNHLPGTRVALSGATLLGFCMLRSNELYQLYVSEAARGTGTAQALIADAETQIANGGHQRAWLDCAIGNNRAANFYKKCGWINQGTLETELETSNGPFTMRIWRFEKSVKSD